MSSKGKVVVATKKAAPLNSPLDGRTKVPTLKPTVNKAIAAQIAKGNATMTFII